MNISPQRIFLLAAACASINQAPVLAQEGPEEGLFDTQRTLPVEIQAPWRDLTRKKSEKRWPATLIFTDATGQRRSVSLTVERRGISRQRICDFPPIRLRFDKESVEGTIFEGEGALKLVTHCDRGERWTQYYVLEMLAYQIYNLITDYSFRVRPMQVSYIDVERSKDPGEFFAFVIEDIDEVADRFDLEELEFDRVYPSRLEPVAASQLALFQLMIANLDYSALTGPEQTCCHNAKMIGSGPDADPVIPIPYDFDVSGFVDTHYAVPPEKLPVRNVRTRLYRGYCAHNDTLPAAREKILAIENEVMALVRSEPRLNERSRDETLEFLEEFYEMLRSDEDFQDEVISECRG